MRHIIRHTRTLVLGAAFAASFVGFGLAPGARAEAPSAQSPATKPDLKKVNEHLTQHQAFPATRAQLLASCNGLVDFSAGEKRWYTEHLPEGTYKTPSEVMKAIGGRS